MLHYLQWQNIGNNSDVREGTGKLAYPDTEELGSCEGTLSTVNDFISRGC